MRYLVWYVVFSLVVGAVLASLLPAVVPFYALIAVVGGTFLVRDLAKGQGPPRTAKPQQPVARLGSSEPRSGISHELPTNLQEALARGHHEAVPSWMRDPATDPNLRVYADLLTSASWSEWQAVSLRAETYPMVVDLYQALIASVGEVAAKAGASSATHAGVAVNSLVLGYFVRQANQTVDRDPRLARTWLDLLDRNHGPASGVIVRGAWGILLRDILDLNARDQCYQPFAGFVAPLVFGLEGS